MLGYVALAAVLSTTFAYLIIRPIVLNLWDPKGLRKFPNHRWFSAITDFQHCHTASQGFRSKALYEAHKERGEPILRIGPNSLSFCGTRAIKDIYGHSTKCIKDDNYTILSGSHRHLFDVVDKPDHARKRRVLSAAFAIKNLEKWEYKVAYTAERLFKALDERCTGPLKGALPDPEDLTVDFNHWVNLWTIEAINYIAVSSRMDLLDKGTDQVIAEKRDGTIYRANYRLSMNQMVLVQSVWVWDYALWPWAKWLTKIIPSKYGKQWKDGETFDDVLYHQIAERLRRYLKGEKLDDFFSCMMEDKTGEPNNLEWGEIVSEISALLNAGFDTTGIAMTHHLDLLLKHPQHLETLRKELDGVLEPHEVIAPYDKVKDLPFLRAVIDESLRVIPPTSAGLPRRTPKEGASILGEWIPGDTSVNMTIYAAHRDPEIFPVPEVFNPHRWMDPDDRRRMEPNFIPFSTGSRGCLGRNISYLEQIMLLASLVHRYEFALPSPSFVVPRFEAFNMVLGPLPIKIWRRTLK
ncbi:unnamed protein product [Clonostachys rosea]|uniref:Cytochrome P450 n=1 Tax=Bionectria ochroleuca TaxID=29856 RepID=A0ABY6TQ85_BIOOC|nr:unnamed protein product [Clonostachys rosea]